MVKICAAGTTVPGYDVSSYQPLSVHAHMKELGAKFCIIKASEGRHIDAMFVAHYREAKAQGMIVGTYDYFHPSQDPIAQAILMAKAIGKPGVGDLGPALDWETTDGEGQPLDLERGLAFLEQIATLTGRDPIIYGGPYFLQALKLDSRFLKYALWVAHYGVACPLVPGPWGFWSFWQWTDGGKSNIDMNKFNGPIEQLNKLAMIA